MSRGVEPIASFIEFKTQSDLSKNMNAFSIGLTTKPIKSVAVKNQTTDHAVVTVVDTLARVRSKSPWYFLK